MRFSLYPSRSQVVGCGIAALMAASFLSVASAQVTLLSDDFSGTSLNTSVWTSGSTGSLGTINVGGGVLTLDTNQNTADARTGVMTDAHNFNPFAAPMTISLTGLNLDASPAAAGNSSSIYGVIGRITSDTGGPGSGSWAATYSAGGGGYGGGLGFSVLEFGNNTWRLQILDSKTGAVQQMQYSLSGVPTDIFWTLDGTTSTWSFEIVGATFTGTVVNQMGGIIANPTTVSGSFSFFEESGITVNGDIVSRFAMGAYNGQLLNPGDHTVGTFGEVTVVSAIPEPSTYALIASAFICGVVVLRRRTRA